MILTKTPFRLSLGGGSTDLPSYYEKYGGFIFGVAIDLYFKVFVARPVIDERVHVRYSKYEDVNDSNDLEHNISREALKIANIPRNIDITFQSDTPAGTGLGSSGSCAVGLLNALHVFKGKPISQRKIAEEAFVVTRNLGWPDGVQDPYIASFGGFVALEIDKNGFVSVNHPDIDSGAIERFIKQTLLFYTGVKRDSIDILSEQDRNKSIEIKHQTKDIGLKIFENFKNGDLDEFGNNMRKHWEIKKKISKSMSSDNFDRIYGIAIKTGALGGKIIGAGGGGYFMFYCPNGKEEKVKMKLLNLGLRQVLFNVDYQGTRFIDVNF